MKSFCSRRDLFRVVFSQVAVIGSFFSSQVFAQNAGVDPSFHPDIIGLVSTVAVQPDGKVLVGGNFSSVNGVPRNYLARLHPDGSLDESFASNNGPAQYVNRVLVAGSKIYVGAGDGLRRYALDGTLEWLYPMTVAAFAVDAQGRVVLGGQFVRLENSYHRNIARLTANGALDNTFTTIIGCCAGEGVYAVATQGDAILAGGSFQSVNATNVASSFARINADGSFDSSFAVAADSPVLSISVASDGTVYRASQQTLARHLSSGANDPAFAPVSAGGSSEDRFVTVIAQPDGKAMVGGDFTLDGTTRGYLARFDADGTRDDSLDVRPDGSVQAMALQANGDVLIAGSFAHVNGQARAGLARVSQSATGSPSVATLSVSRGGSGSIVFSWSAEQANYTLQSRELDGDTWNAVAGVPVVVNGMNTITTAATGGGRIYRLVSQL
jgi:uncharacterized delta-60 repeat protein